MLETRIDGIMLDKHDVLHRPLRFFEVCCQILRGAGWGIPLTSVWLFDDDIGSSWGQALYLIGCDSYSHAHGRSGEGRVLSRTAGVRMFWDGDKS